MVINVSPTAGKPTHDIKLTKGEVQLGLILCDQSGNHITRSNREPYPNTAIKMYQGDAKHSDREPPYMDIIQDDWSLGRGQEIFEDDKSRYQDAFQADTIREGKIILGPQPTYSTGIRAWGGYMPGSVVWQGLYGTQRYLQRGWTTAGGFSADKCEILLRKKGSPNSGVTIQLRDTTLGTTYKTIAIAAADITDDYLSVWVEGDWSTTYSLGGTTEYRLVVYATSGSDDVDNCWEVGCEPYDATSLNSSKSSDGSSWTSTSTSFGIYFRVLDVDSDFVARFVEYRDQLYFVTHKDDGSAAKLYMNGDRGLADDNTGSLNQLIDSSKSWSASPGSVVFMITGEANMLDSMHRTITGYTSSTVTVSPNFNIVHNPNVDEYVILGSNSWVERANSSTLTKPANSIAVANDIMYIAQGRDEALVAHRETIHSGAFYWVNGTVDCWDTLGVYAEFVLSVPDYISGPVLYFGRNGYYQGYAEIFRDAAPKGWKSGSVAGFYQLVPGGTAGQWGESTIGNVTNGVEAGITSWIDVADAFTTGIIATHEVDPAANLRFATHASLWIRSSIDLAAGVLELVFDDTALCASPIAAVPMPFMKAGEWVNDKLLHLNFDIGDVVGAEAVISVGWRLTQDVGAVKIEIQNGLRVFTTGSTIPISIPDARITSMIRYGEPETCWVLCNNQFGEVRNGYYQQVPIRELAAVKQENNGRASLVHDVYLYFGLGQGIEKYYNQHLDDIGPNRDLGLPSERQGEPSCMVGYPGRIYAGYDAGFTGYSAVYCYNKGGWSEVYRSRIAGRRIRSMFIQSVPGENHSRLWISEGSDILWIPIALNPLNDTGYRYTYESAVITSRIHGGLQDVSKFFKSVKLATKNLDTIGCQVYVDYRVDGGAGWTRIANAFDTSPYQEENFSSTYDISGRWIELRIVLQTSDNTETPEVLAYVIKAIEREIPKYANTYTFRVKDRDRDLMGDPQDYRVDDFMGDLESMINDPLPILVNSISELDDSKYVVSQPTSLKRIRIIPEEDGNELHICQITLLEI